ncbi:hypothetical protein [Pseudomonas sp. NPDC087804]|uniref:hypothetical protein n=1 Tax=Pseudomonas sp. NPDC087804 TaxID=3364449 RepID=UPI00380215EF
MTDETDQSINGGSSDENPATETSQVQSDLINTADLSTPYIFPPTNVGVGFSPKVSGYGDSGATVRVYVSGDESTVYGTATVGPFNLWEVTLDKQLPANINNLTCRQTVGGNHSQWASPVKFTCLAPPIITPDDDVIDFYSNISGTSMGLTPTKIDLYEDMSDERIGGSDSTFLWMWVANFNESTKPGVITVTAKLNRHGILSERSGPVTFLRRPNYPLITRVEYRGTTTVFFGTGYPKATIEINHESGSPIATALVAADGKYETTPITLPPGTTGIEWGARQKIFDRDWIYSLYHPQKPVFDVPTCAPTINAPTLIEQIPTVTGRGSIWEGLAAAKIEVVLQGATNVALDQATVTATGDWTATTATAVAPGSYTVSVRQLMNGVYSLPVTAPAPLIIKPLAPTDILVVPDGLSATFSGSCWPSASLMLLINDGKQEIPIPVTGAPDGKWTSLPITFVPRKYTFTVTQTFSEQTSPPAGPVEFKIATPTPVIIFPGNQQETDFRPEIKGTNGYDGATVAVFDNTVQGPALGQTIVPASGIWAVKLDKELVVGEHDIYAQQTSEKQASDRSVSVRFAVKVPKPLLTPVPNNYYPRRSTFSGTGWPGAVVKLSFDGVDYPVTGGIKVDANGQWVAPVFLEPVGGKKLKITQSYGGGDGVSMDYSFVTVTNAPDLESPSAGEWVDPSSMVVSGYTHPGDTVVVRRLGAGAGDNLGTFLADSEGRWSGTVKKIEGDTNYSYWAYSTKDSIGGDPSDTAVVNLQDLTAPLIVHPADGDFLVPRVLFSGQGLPGATIQVADLFNPAINHAPTTTVDQSGYWSVEGNTDLNPGPNWVIVQQTLGEKKSPWVRSGRFIIEYPLTGFSAPTVDRPFPGEEVGLQPMLAGTGVAGAKIHVRQNGKDLAQAWVDVQGRWALRLPAFAEGSQSLTVIQASDEIWSAELKPNPTFEVVQVSAGFPAPTIESPTAGATVDTRFWMSGKGMPGAVVRARDFYNGAILYGEGSVDAYGQWRMCLSHAAALKNFTITVQQTLDDKNSLFSPGVTVNVENALPAPILESHSNGEQIAPATLLKGRGHPRATVFLYKSGEPNNPLASANVTEDGYWECVTKPLPLGNIRMGGRQMLPSIVGPWMNEFTFQVVNAG